LDHVIGPDPEPGFIRLAPPPERLSAIEQFREHNGIVQGRIERKGLPGGPGNSGHVVQFNILVPSV